ncbi:MAG: hypothetical protein ACPG5P_00780, partial [Saprospiraceae bacterium]
MQYKVFNFCTILFFSLISSSLFAQMSASGDMAELDMNSNTDIIFPSTENENIYYLDLEKVEGHL